MASKKSRKRGVGWRLGAVVMVITVAAVGLVARLVQLQVIDHSYYAAEARDIHVAKETVTGRRGALLDRNGYPLAASKDTYDVMVEVKAWDDGKAAAEAAAAIATVTKGDPQKMVSEVEGAEIYEIAVARSLDFDAAAKIRELGLRGVRLLRGSTRVHPEGNLAAQLLGFVGQDNTGLTGLEADLESLVGGAQGTVIFERDGLGNQLALGSRSERDPQPGSQVVLSIDRFVQRMAERELDRAIKEHKASGGTIIAVQPKTGEILAMASRPTFDLTKPDLSDESKLALFRNRAITDQYEPGSVFKLITTAAAVDLGLVNPNTWWFDSGVVNVDGWSIRNWDFSANGSQTVMQILAKSLNTGAAWLSQQLGPERFYDYVFKFGFGEPSGSGLGGEVNGRVRTPDNDPENWRTVDMATNSFGQGISVTPLQMVMAVAALANEGKLMKPMLVKEIIGPHDKQVSEPQVTRQVVSADTARTLLDMMGVVVQGIPRNFLDIQGYEIGGKTGTASIASGTGSYKGTYISSFIGVAPLEDPQLVILVKIDEPKDTPWGTVVAAPAFSRMAQAALAYFKIPPQEADLVRR
ncbi:MAG: penicillin-binding protein 2 [Dehalococcoidia bacterium]|nr:penicillin-binding protein 2 [Dehalococcoidia bacterium]